MNVWLILQLFSLAGQLGIADEAAALRERPLVSEPAERDPHLDAVFAAWKERETTNRKVSLEFAVERTSRAANFGSSADDSSPGEEAVYRLLIDDARFRFDGVGEPPIEIGGEPISVGSITVEKSEEERYQEYLAALWSAFDPPPRSAVRQPYVLIRGAEKTVQFWGSSEGCYPRALITEAQAEHSLVSRDAQPIEPVLLALRPFSLAVEPVVPGRCTLQRTPVQIDGTACLRVEEVISEELPRSVRRYWVDPTRDFLVVRFLSTTEGEQSVQFDVEYDTSAEGEWVPARWTVLRVNPYGGVREFATFSRVLSDRQSGIEEQMLARFEPGTWVVDLVSGRQALITENGAERPLSFVETSGGATYEALLTGKSPDQLRSLHEQSISMQRVVMRLLSWPHVVWALPALWIVIALMGLAVRHIGRHFSRGAGKPQSALGSDRMLAGRDESFIAEETHT